MRNRVVPTQPLQRIDDLHFFLYHRALHPELFHVFEVRHLQQKRYTAEIWITGLSHVVMVQAKNQVVTELTASDSEMLPKMGLVTRFRFRGEKDHLQRLDGGMQYIMSSQVERMTPNLFAASHRDLTRYAQKRGIFREFPEWASGDHVPFTFVDYECRDGELHVHAFHAFPEEATLLKTQSIFELSARTSAPIY
ncbi:MAG: DUF2617 family protein [Planctomycetes bacterium]|nr:DUF2617 family protein [Planctomycetota bacterium]MCH8964743.1 DUF2617 family protein [Planctomycetota bacterium]